MEQMIINAVVLGTNYALIALGITLIFSIMNILNFAHATLWLVAGYLTYTLFQVFTAVFGDSALLLIPAIILATGAMFALA